MSAGLGPAAAAPTDAPVAVTGEAEITEVVAPVAGDWSIERVSLAADGSQTTDGDSGAATISGDGAAVAFSSTATLIAGQERSGSGDVYVRDLATEATQRVSDHLDGSEATVALPYADAPHLSHDGSRAFFSSHAGSQVRAWWRDRPAPGAEAFGSIPSSHVRTSADGTRATYFVLPTWISGQHEAWVLDVASGARRSLVTLAQNGSPVDTADPPTISADGNVAAVVARIGGEYKLVVRDLPADLADALPAADVLPVVPSRWGVRPALSGDGRYVAYVSSNYQVRLFDRQERTDEQVLVLRSGDDVRQVELSADGRHVGILVDGWGDPEDFDVPRQIWLHDRHTGETSLVVGTGHYEQGDPEPFAMTLDGTAVAFSSGRDDLVAGDTNGRQDVFVAMRAPGSNDTAAPKWPSSGALEPVDVGATFVRLAWPEASDDVGVDGYRLLRNGDLVEQVGPDVLAYTMDRLSPSTTYEFALVALDAAGNASEHLTATATTSAQTVTPGTARLDAAALAGGRVQLSWEEATQEGLEGYRVFRAIGSQDAAEAVADVGPGETQYEDAGLPAATTVRYVVGAVHGGELLPHTSERVVTTPALPITGVTWTAPRAPGGTLLTRADVTITLDGAPGWHGTARVEHLTWIDDQEALLPQPRAAVSVVDLQEDEPGSYVGTFTLAEGIAELTGIAGVLSDAHGQEATVPAARLPAPVSGAAVVDVSPSDTDFAGWTVVTSSLSTRVSTSGSLTGARLNLALPAAADHRVSLLRPDGRRGALVNDVQIQAGRTTPVDMTAVVPASADILVQDPGGSPLGQVQVVATDAAGSVVYSATTGDDGRVSAERLDAGVSVALKAPRATPYVAPASVILSAGHNELTLQLDRLAAATLAGVVTTPGGEPTSGARVTMSQRLNGDIVNSTVETGPDGTYELGGFAGVVSVHVDHWFGRLVQADSEVTLAGGSNILDVQLTKPDSYRVTVDLRTQQPGESMSAPLDIDPDTARAFSLSIQTPSGEVGPWGYSRTPDGWLVHAYPGEQVTVCGNGAGIGLPAECVDVEFGEVNAVTANLRLRAVSQLKADVLGADGRPATSTLWTAMLSGPEGDIAITGGGPRLLLPISTPGEWTLSLHGPTCASATESCLRQATAPVVVDVPDATVVELEPFRLNVAGLFAGPGNGMSTQQPQIQRGGTVEMRTAFRSDHPAPLEGVIARLALPFGTMLEPDSLMLNGAPVDGIIGDGHVDVDLGTVAANGSGTLRHTIRLVEDLYQGYELHATARMLFPGATAGGDLVGGVVVPVAAVTLSPPSIVRKHGLTVSGRGPAGETVELFDADTFLGRSDISPAGSWSMAVTLPDRGLLFDHQLHASVARSGMVVRSRVASVRYDPSVPELQSATVGYRTFNPAEGIPKFGLVVTPFSGQQETTLTFGMTFADPQRVEGLSVRAGTGAAAAVLDDGSHHATVSVNPFGAGPVTLDYGWSREPIALNDSRWRAPKTHDDVRERLPGALRDFANVEVTETDGEVGGAAASGRATVTQGSSTTAQRVQADLPGMGDGATLDATMSITRGVSYTPTAEDLELQRVTGLPVWGVRNSMTVDGATISGKAFAYVPESELDGDPHAAVAMLMGAVGAEGAGGHAEPGDAKVGIQSHIVGTARVGFQYAFQITTAADDVYGAGEGLYDAIMGKDKYSKILRLLGAAQDLIGCAPSATSERLLDKVDTLHNKALANDAMAAAWTIVGAVAGPATFGVGTIALWAVGYASGKVLDHALENDIEEVSKEIAKAADDSECRKSPQPSRGDRVTQVIAEPVLIYDPSGYVYEVADEHRVEGATATVLESQGDENGPWAPWDATWFDQTNPMTTDAEGRYGWDVPQGWWKVMYEKEGYETTYSGALKVLPPHFDVNVPLTWLGGADIDAASAVPGGPVDVRFDRFLRATFVTNETFAVHSGGQPLAGTISPVDVVTMGGEPMAQRFRFTPAEALAEGTELMLQADEVLQTYAGVPLGGVRIRNLVVSAVANDDTDPGGGGGGENGGGGDDPGPGDGVTSACPGAEVPPARFLDVPADSTHAGNIACLVWWQLARGLAPDRYGPSQQVRRDQMATFIVNLIRAAGADLPAGLDAFADDGHSVHHESINALAAGGVVRGFGDRSYRPSRPVSRAQMATYLMAAYRYVGGETPASARDRFSDDNDNVHEMWINAAAQLGVAVGTSPTTYSPDTGVTREQMASFLTGVLDLAVSNELASLPDQPSRSQGR